VAFPVTDKYFLRFRHSDIGLTPTFSFFKRTDTLADVTPPVVVELANGTYYFELTFTTAADPGYVFEVDGGSSIPTEEVRYIADTVSPKDYFLDEPVSQVVEDVWNDVANRDVGTKGAYVRNIGDPTDNSGMGFDTLFSKIYEATRTITGEVIEGHAGNNIWEVMQRLGIDSLIMPGDTVSQDLNAILNNVTAGTGAVEAAITAAKVDIKGGDPGKDLTQVDGHITSAQAAVQGADVLDLSSVEAHLDVSIAAARDNVKGGSPGRNLTEVDGAIESAVTSIKGPGPRDITEVYNRTTTGTDLTDLAAVIKGPQGLSISEVAGTGFTPGTDDLHAIKDAAVPLARSQDIIDIKARTTNLPVNTSTTLAEMSTLIMRALGMLHENSVLDLCSYDPLTNNLLAARLRTYSTKADSIAAKALGDGTTYDTNKIGQYSIVAEYNGDNMTNYMIVREYPV
jgi:hypothetical protein